MAEGLQKIPAWRIPKEWSAEWFQSFIRQVLALADTRNATPGPGVTISGQPDQPATISATADVLQLLEQNYVLATTSAFLPNERILEGETGSVSITDHGPGSGIVVGIEANGIGPAKFRQSDPNSVVGNPTAATANVTDISSVNDGDVLSQQGGLLGFGKITSGSVSDFAAAAENAVGGILLDSDTIDFTYTPGVSIQADVNDGSLLYAKLQNATALSVLGRGADSSGVLSDIVAASLGDVLQYKDDGPGGDPDFSNVTALMHFDGTNGSTTFTDEIGHTFSAVSGAKLSTANKEFGTAALILNGSSDYITTPDNADFDFGSGDFTIECWVYADTSVSNGVISKRPATADGWAIEVRNTGALWLRAKVAGSYSDTQVATAGGAVASNTWTYIALTRSGTAWRFFVNGVVQVNTTISGTLDNQSVALAIGNSVYNTPEDPFNGSIDELRITKGIARYTANFTPPAAPFPDATGGPIVEFGPLVCADAAAMLTSIVDFNDGAAAASGTLTNAPTAGNPTKWIPIDDNGTTRYIPTWT